MNLSMSLSAGPLVSLLAGILILIVPRLLNYIVAVYLIIIGLLGLVAAARVCILRNAADTRRVTRLRRFVYARHANTSDATGLKDKLQTAQDVERCAVAHEPNWKSITGGCHAYTR